MLLAAALNESDRDALAGWSGEKHVASILFRRGAGTRYGNSLGIGRQSQPSVCLTAGGGGGEVFFFASPSPCLKTHSPRSLSNVPLCAPGCALGEERVESRFVSGRRF